MFDDKGSKIRFMLPNKNVIIIIENAEKWVMSPSSFIQRKLEEKNILLSFLFNSVYIYMLNNCVFCCLFGEICFVTICKSYVYSIPHSFTNHISLTLLFLKSKALIEMPTAKAKSKENVSTALWEIS
jgi:hypothetical protein